MENNFIKFEYIESEEFGLADKFFRRDRCFLRLKEAENNLFVDEAFISGWISERK